MFSPSINKISYQYFEDTLIIYLNSNDGLKIWIPTRAKNKLLDPGKFDNSVAGGIAINETAKVALEREALEEAGVNTNIVINAKPVGIINYCWKKNFSLRPDMLFIFDLKVGKKFIPKCLDGEVNNFTLMNWEDIRNIINDTNKFKLNCSLVLIDFFIRHGLINHENEKDYEMIASSLNLGNIKVI